jgi:protein-L-isoaspartate O-methyltransferase
MGMIRKVGISKKVSLYNEAILRAERKLVRNKSVQIKGDPAVYVDNARLDQHLIFKTHTERYALHVVTHPNVLMEIFRKVPFPKKDNFADLGCGLGMQCFIAANFFKNVTGYEINKAVFTEAENIRGSFNLNNVRFENSDFLNADLRPYNALFMYLPFYRDFVELMSEKLKETSPGTLIISFKYKEEDVFPKKHFEAFYPDKFTDICRVLPSTFVFKRK